MQKLINFCGKYRKVILLILTAVIVLLICFPLRQTVFPYGSKKTVSDYHPAFIGDEFVLTPHIFGAFYWFFNIEYSQGTQQFNQGIASFFFFVAFLFSLIGFWLYELKNKKGIFIIPLIFAFIAYCLVSYEYSFGDDLSVKLTFRITASFIVFILIIALYSAFLFITKLYPQMQPKVAETVTKVADKVKSHKSKSERIEELERQNAEMQRSLDELEHKNHNTTK